MRSAISCPRAASRSEVTLSWGHSVRPPHGPRYLAGTRTGPPFEEGVSTPFTETHKTGSSPQIIPRWHRRDEGNQSRRLRGRYQRRQPRNGDAGPVTSRVRNSALQPRRKARTAPASQRSAFSTSQCAQAYLGWSGGTVPKKRPKKEKVKEGELEAGEMGKKRQVIERRLFTCYFCLSAGGSYKPLHP